MFWLKKKTSFTKTRAQKTELAGRHADPFDDIYSGGVITAGRSAAVLDATDDPEAALRNVKAWRRIGTTENVDFMVAALEYCAKDTPCLEVRAVAAEELSQFSLSAFRDIAQIMRCLERVVSELGRIDEIMVAQQQPELSEYHGKLASSQENLLYQLGQFTSELGQREFQTIDEITPFIKQLEDELQWFEDNDGTPKSGFESNPIYQILRPTLDGLILKLEKLEDDNR
ncbi:MAG: hypothetical protein M1608_01305 [Candidatus Omnitrophica bacterium]|nr:hypothetical protein [Candidatus Omnitrophota bacterium]